MSIGAFFLLCAPLARLCPQLRRFLVASLHVAILVNLFVYFTLSLRTSLSARTAF